jgi:hypothetical protein
MLQLITGRIVTIVTLLSSAVLVAQDAVKTLPDTYKVQFDNEYVRVTRVHYRPNVKLPPHTHTSLPSAYVYLNDSGPVVFKHVGAEYGAVTRQPTVARSFRLFRGVEEIHEVENLSSTSSDFLRVEFKTDPVDPRTLRGKFLPGAQGAEVTRKVEFENAQLRVIRVVVPKDGSAEITTLARPSLLISLSEVDLGKATFLPNGETHVIANPSASAVEVLQLELKTRPLS